MNNSTRATVLNIGRTQLDTESYRQFLKEYLKIEKYVMNLCPQTQVDLVLNFMYENET